MYYGNLFSVHLSIKICPAYYLITAEVIYTKLGIDDNQDMTFCVQEVEVTLSNFLELGPFEVIIILIKQFLTTV